jgi:hypothetical protein
MAPRPLHPPKLIAAVFSTVKVLVMIVNFPLVAILATYDWALDAARSDRAVIRLAALGALLTLTLSLVGVGAVLGALLGTGAMLVALMLALVGVGIAFAAILTS